MPSAELSSLPFKDLYLDCEDISRSFYAPAVLDIPNGINPIMDVPAEFLEELLTIKELVEGKYRERRDFAFNFGDIRLRGCRQIMMNSVPWVAFRRIPIVIPDLVSLEFEGIIPMIERWGRRSGLLLIGGSTGAGKTTTAFATLQHYLIRYGRVAYLIENPTEFLLHGKVGLGGFCHQREIQNDADWEDAFHGALRWNPRYVLVGEVTSPIIAQQLIRLSTAQCLVIGTVHAPNVWETINAVIQYAESSDLGASARTHLASGLLAVVHQTLRRNRPILEILEVPEHNHDVVNSTARQMGGLNEKNQLRSAIRDNNIAFVREREMLYSNGKFLNSSVEAA